MIFSAKEAFYKCQHPLTRAWVGFEDVSVEIGAERFRIVDTAGLGLDRLSRAPLTGAFALWRGYVVSAMALRASDRVSPSLEHDLSKLCRWPRPAIPFSWHWATKPLASVSWMLSSV
ncbi:hypothetical protein ACRAWD_04315 [Caulobacter segnis]